VGAGAGLLQLACSAACRGSWLGCGGQGAVRPWQVRTGPGWSDLCGGRAAGGSEQVLPFVLAVPAFGQVQGEVAAAVPGDPGGNGDQVTVDGRGPGLGEGQAGQGAGGVEEVVRHGRDRQPRGVRGEHPGTACEPAGRW
jgi:hypothetical protein